MSEVVIHVEGLGKRYRVGQRESYHALRDVLARAFASPFRRKRPIDFLWALEDINFDVKQGEVVGLIGRNGAGKTTLLKLLSRITRPTSGFAEIRGRVGSLLEVGTGFHPELTGRENVYLSGAILGMSKREIDSKHDAIVEFAGVERFLDSPLKHYSTGMQMRLAFSVAAHLEPEILLVDEVLAVGDMQFQKKCLGKMGEVAKTGRTIVFVSHQMNQIRRLCERVIWIDAGGVARDGSASEVVAAYEAEMSSGEATGTSTARGERTRFVSWAIREAPATLPNNLATMGRVTVVFTVKVHEPVKEGHHGIALFNADRQVLWGWAIEPVNLAPGIHELEFTFPMLPLRPGPYYWQVSLWGGEKGLLDLWDCLPEMIVSTEVHQHQLDQWNGVLNLPFTFDVNQVRVATVG
jgi:lipopolysaccharide transport system ATP-binding protein